MSYAWVWPSKNRPVHNNFYGPLEEKFGDRFSRKRAICEQHGRDESPYAPAPPDGVAFATSVEEVAWLAKFCDDNRVPLIAFGAGSSLEGQVLAGSGRHRVGRRGRLHRHRRGWRDPRAVERSFTLYRSVLSSRSGCRCKPRRHGGDQGIGHQCCELRDDARERCAAARGHREWQSDPDRKSGTQVLGRLRPDQPFHWQRSYARHYHGTDRPHLSATWRDVSGGMQFRDAECSGCECYRDHPDGHLGRKG